ncbi:MAG: hypothetical protein GY729_12315 [Desulfobacteraceae bacterium]|nr:hypothetical protein [Desulfobacteraceae bacterium]
MDHTASLRKKRKAIELMQKSEEHLAKKKYKEAQVSLKKALKKEGSDYTGNVLMSKCMLLQKNAKSSLKFANRAKKIYPSEAQGYYVAGLACSELKKHDRAYQNFKNAMSYCPATPR